MQEVTRNTELFFFITLSDGLADIGVYVTQTTKVKAHQCQQHCQPRLLIRQLFRVIPLLFHLPSPKNASFRKGERGGQGTGLEPSYPALAAILM